MRVTSRTVCPGWPRGGLGRTWTEIVDCESGRRKAKIQMANSCRLQHRRHWHHKRRRKLQGRAAPGQHRCWQQLLAQARQVDMAKSIDHFGSYRVPPLWARPLWAGTIQDMGNNRVVEEEEEEEERKIYWRMEKKWRERAKSRTVCLGWEYELRPTGSDFHPTATKEIRGDTCH